MGGVPQFVRRMRVRDGDDAHARGEGGGDAGLGVFDHPAVGRRHGQQFRGAQKDIRRRFAAFNVRPTDYSRKEPAQPLNAEDYRAVVSHAKDQGVRVRGYLSMVFADPWDGPTPTRTAVDTGQRLLDLGCDELSLGDTIGVATAGEVTTLIVAYRDAGVGVERLALHFHDTYGQALANVLAAMAAGVSVYDASAGGIGGSPFARMAGGNLASEDLVWMCRGIGIATGVDIEKLVAASRWLGAQLGRELPGHVARALNVPRSAG